MSNEPLHRWLRDRAKAQRSLAVDRQVSALARVGQVSRSTIQIAEDEVGLDDALTSGVDAEQNNDLTDENLDLSDDNTDLISDFQDELDWMYEDYDEARAEDSEEIIQLYDDLADAEEHLAEVQAELNEKLSGLDIDLDAASERLTEAVNRVTAAESAIQQAQQDITAAVNAASQAQIEAVFAQGMLTVSASAPTAANAQGKKLGAVWMHRVGTGIATLYELTSVGWTLRPLSETIIPQIAIGTGTYGELAGERLLAKSVGAEKVVIGSYQNLVQDPGGYSIRDFWSNTARIQAGVGPNGGSGLVYEQSNVAMSAYNATGTTGTRPIATYGIPVVGGDRYRISGLYKAAAANAGNTAIIQGHFYRADGSFITGAQIWVYGQAPTADTWYPISTERDAPADAAYLRFSISKVSTYTGGTLTIADPLVRSMTSGELLVDGAIAARHVATGTFQAVAATIAEAWIRSGHIVDLDVSKLAVTGNASISQAVIERLYTDVVRAKLLTVTEKIITRDIIATGAIGAAELSADAINGKTITGAIIRTSAAWQRVQIDANGIRCFNPFGLETARLAASVGGLLLTGGLVSEDVQSGIRSILSGGEMRFMRISDERVTLALSEAGIRSYAAGIPLQIVHEAEGANSDVEIDAGKNNRILMKSEVEFLGDTGWIDIPIQSPFGLYANGTFRAKRVNGETHVQGTLTCNTANHITGTTRRVVGTLPPELVPEYTQVFVCQGSGTDRWTFEALSNGALTASRYSGSQTTNVWLPLSVVFMR